MNEKYPNQLESIPKPDIPGVTLKEIRNFMTDGINHKTLFIKIPKCSDANEINGLHAYLLKIKPNLQELGITGIAYKK
jgi:hypothetical protein